MEENNLHLSNEQNILFIKYIDLVNNIFKGYKGNNYSSYDEDFKQEILIKIICIIKNSNNIFNLDGYIYSMIKYTYIDNIRKVNYYSDFKHKISIINSSKNIQKDNIINNIINKEIVEYLLSKLNKNDKFLIIKYFGLDGNKETLKKIAILLDKTISYIRQRKCYIMKKLREIKYEES